MAGQLLVTAGQNHDRLRSEAAFAMLCGAAPVPASTGRTHRHRLNRGADRHANTALYRVVIEMRARLSPIAYEQINFLGRYAFSRPEVAAGLRPFYDPAREGDAFPGAMSASAS